MPTHSESASHGTGMASTYGYYIDGLVQDCSNSIALAMELL